MRTETKEILRRAEDGETAETAVETAVVQNRKENLTQNSRVEGEQSVDRT